MINKRLVSILYLLLLSFTLNVSASKDSLPSGYSKYLSYIANGVYDSSIPHSTVPGCVAGFCDGNYFQTEIMGRDQATIDVLQSQAEIFYLNRFGIDVNAPENSGRVLFRSFMLDPRLEYRAYHVSGMKAPEEGWVVRDGGWILIITDPNGFTLGGEFSGLSVAAGTMFFYGEYNIDVKKPKSKYKSDDYDNDENIIISYRAGTPALTNSVGLLPFSCQVALKPLTENFSEGTEGLAQGIATAIVPDINGIIRANVRNALTFNDQGGR